jgi:hypothetical protein
MLTVKKLDAAINLARFLTTQSQLLADKLADLAQEPECQDVGERLEPWARELQQRLADLAADVTTRFTPPLERLKKIPPLP